MRKKSTQSYKTYKKQLKNPQTLSENKSMIQKALSIQNLISKNSFLIFNIGSMKENITNHTFNKFFKNK